MNHVELTPGWQANLTQPVDTMVVNTMMHVRDDARSICPVDTGDLKDSLTVVWAGQARARMISHLPYFAAVELGFHGLEEVSGYETRGGHYVHPYERYGNTPSQPFARPALWRRRTPS